MKTRKRSAGRLVGIVLGAAVVLAGSGCSTHASRPTAELLSALEASSRITAMSAAACVLVGNPATWSSEADASLSTMFDAAVNQASTVSRIRASTDEDRRNRAAALRALRFAETSIGECSTTQADTSGPFSIELAVWRVGTAAHRIDALAGELRSRTRA